MIVFYFTSSQIIILSNHCIPTSILVMLLIELFTMTDLTKEDIERIDSKNEKIYKYYKDDRQSNEI